MTTYYREVTRLGNVGAGEYDQLWIPETIRGASKYGVVLLHGASAAGVTTGFDWENNAWPATSQLAAVLARAGIPCVAAHMGGNHYANDTAMGKITTAISYLSTATGCSASKAHLIGLSMGGGAAIRYAGLNPSKVASITSIVGTASLDRAHRENNGVAIPSGFTQGIATAWGLTNRTVTDAAVTNGSAVMTSTAADFTGADVGRVVARGVSQTAIPLGTTILSVEAENSVTLSANATATASGQTVCISAPLPMSGSPSADLIGDFAPVIDSNNIDTVLGYATNDPFVLQADVLSLATACGGTALSLGATGHANAAAAAFAADSGGSAWSALVSRLKANGA